MENEVPLGYWIKSCTEKYLCIGFQYGGHIGGECEIFLPKEKLSKFKNNNSWRRKTIGKFSRILFLGIEDMNIPIPYEEKKKNGIVPEVWI